MDLRIIGIPERLKAELKSEAALANRTLNEYVIALLESRSGPRRFGHALPREADTSETREGMSHGCREKKKRARTPSPHR